MSEPRKPASPKVDALFAGEPPPAPKEAEATIQRIKALLIVALPFNLLGIPCGIGVPGAFLSLWAYLLADGEMTRVEDGLYRPEDAATLSRLRSWTSWTLLFCVASFAIQAHLLFYEGYRTWLLSLIGWITGV